MLLALEKSLGIVTQACRAAGIGRTQHYEWMKEDAEYRASVEEISNVALDFAETRLLKQIEADVPVSTIFYLKTKGKKRGYVEASEQVIYTPEKGPTWLDGSSID